MQITIARLAELSGLHRDTVRKRCAKLIGEGRGATVESSEALALLYGSERLDPSAERAMLDRTRREALEMANAKTRRELITLNEVFKILDVAAVTFREDLMGLAGRLSDELAAESDPFAVHRTLEGEIRAALTRLSEAKEAFGIR